MKKKLSCLFLVFSLLFASIATNNVFAEPEETPISISDATITLSLLDGTTLPYDEETKVVSNITTDLKPSDINVTVTSNEQPLTLDSDYTLSWWKQNAGGDWIPIGNNDNFTLNDNYKLDIVNCSNTFDFKTITFTVIQGSTETIDISTATITLSLKDGTSLPYNEEEQVVSGITADFTPSDINVAVIYNGKSLTLNSDYLVSWLNENADGIWEDITSTEKFISGSNGKLYVTNKNNLEDLQTIFFTVGQGEDIAVTSISLDTETINMFINDKSILAPTVEPSNASNQEVTWFSDNETVATVDSSGQVTAVAEGTATITVTSKSNNLAAAQCTVTVQSRIENFALNKTEATIYLDETLELSPSFQNADGNWLVIPSYTWDSTNKEVATVNNYGVVTPIAKGDTTITVTIVDTGHENDKKTATCEVTVKERPAPTAITLDKTSITCTPGDHYTLTVAVSPEDEIQTFTVTSDNDDVVEYGQIDESHVGFRAKAIGTATITVKSDADPNKFATCKVTVNHPTITALDHIYNQDLWKSEELYNEAIKHLPIAIISGQYKINSITKATLKSDEIPTFHTDFDADNISYLLSDFNDLIRNQETMQWLLDKFGIAVLENNTLVFISPEFLYNLPTGTYTLDLEGTDVDGTTFTGTTKITIAKNTYYDDLTWVKGSSDDLTIASMPNLTADVLKKTFTIADLSLAKNFEKVETEIDDDIFNVDENGNLKIKKEMLEILAKDLKEDTNFNIEFTLKPKQSMFPQGPWVAEALIAKRGHSFPFSTNSGTKIDVNFKIALTAPSTGTGDTGNGDNGTGDTGAGDTGTGSGGGGYNDGGFTSITDDSCTHEWTDATCTTPKTCSKCGETEGEALGHKYTEEVIAPTSSFLGATFCTCSNTGCNSSYYKDYTLLAGSHPTRLPNGETISGSVNVMKANTTITRNGKKLDIILQDPLGVITKSGDTFELEATQLTDTSALDATHAVEYIHAYEINPKVNGTIIKGDLGNKVRMLYEVPSDWDKKDLQVVLLQSDKDVEFDESTEIINGKEYLVVWTDHFSPYAFIDTLSAEEKANNTAQGQNGGTFVKTGESNVCLVTALLLSTISAGLFLEICLRKKFKKQ